MKANVIIAALIVSFALANAADKAPDLTGADAKMFKAHVGSVVSLCGRLEQGKQGACLLGATPNDIVFYVIPNVPPGGFTWPVSWTRLTQQQVRVTGELKFRSFNRTNAVPLVQSPPDYFYMVLQHTAIQRLDTK